MHLNGLAPERRVCAKCFPTLKEMRFTGASAQESGAGLQTRSDFYLKINPNQSNETRKAPGETLRRWQKRVF